MWFFPIQWRANVLWNSRTQSKSTTTCGNDWVTNIMLVQSPWRISRILKRSFSSELKKIRTQLRWDVI